MCTPPVLPYEPQLLQHTLEGTKLCRGTMEGGWWLMLRMAQRISRELAFVYVMDTLAGLNPLPGPISSITTQTWLPFFCQKTETPQK